MITNFASRRPNRTDPWLYGSYGSMAPWLHGPMDDGIESVPSHFSFSSDWLTKTYLDYKCSWEESCHRLARLTQFMDVIAEHTTITG